MTTQKDWWCNVAANFLPSFLIFLMGLAVAKPAYDHLYNATIQNNNIDMRGSQNSTVTILQGVEAARQVANDESVKTLSEPLQTKMKELKRVSEDILATPGSWDALNQPTPNVTWDKLNLENWEQARIGGDAVKAGQDKYAVEQSKTFSIRNESKPSEEGI